MQNLNSVQLLERINGTWVDFNLFWDNKKGTDIMPIVHPMNIFANVIEGKVVSDNTQDLGSHTLVTGVIQNPTFNITNEQLCQIMDEGNHCLSKGSIIYEGNYAYITWSNLGHI